MIGDHHETGHPAMDVAHVLELTGCVEGMLEGPRALQLTLEFLAIDVVGGGAALGPGHSVASGDLDDPRLEPIVDHGDFHGCHCLIGGQVSTVVLARNEGQCHR